MRSKLLGVALLTGLLSTQARAQTEPTDIGDPLREQREAMAGLDAKRITTGVLLDRAVPLSNPHRFAGQGDTLTDVRGWEQQYWEFYNASLNQQGLATREQLWRRIDERLQGNVVPLLMLKYRYDELLPDAAKQGLITVDSLKEVMFDGPDLSRSPYTQGQVFSVALAHNLGNGPLSVYVGKEFWLGNQQAPDYVWLDFGDGAGWRQVAMGSTVEIQVKPADGEILMRTQGAMPAQTVYAYDPTDWSLALTNVQYRAQASVAPDLALGLLASRTWPGFTPSGANYAQSGRAKAIAWIKYAQSNTTGKLRKPLVFVEGIDFAQDRSGRYSLGPFTIPVSFENYHVTGTGPISLANFTTGLVGACGFRNGAVGWNEMVDYNPEYKALEQMAILRQSLQNGTAANDGDYDMIFLDFSDGASLIQHNAMVLVELLEWINQPANRAPNAAETVVIGASMGGQVARFGLTWMEQQGLCHNSKLYVSFDSPNRGANVPIGLQHMFDRLQNIWIGSGGAQDGVRKLRREAAQQMLVYHFDGGATGKRNQWQGWQNSTNSYPSLLRKVAVANGSGQAVNQAGMWAGMEIAHTQGSGIVTGPNHAYALPGTTAHGQNNVVFRYKKAISISGTWHQFQSDPGWGNYDTSPGSMGRVAGDAHDASSSFAADWETDTFMPTISALDIRDAGPVVNPNFGYNVRQQIPASNLPNRAKYAFDAYFAAGTVNEPHIQITNGQGSTHGAASYYTDNSSWMRNELRESAHGMPAVLTGMYNLASPYRHLLPSVQINNGSSLSINNCFAAASGGTAATQVTPYPGLFEAYTSSCGTVVRVMDHGTVYVGSSAGFVGTAPTHPANLRISANSLLDVQSGGAIMVNEGSTVRIAAGATLVIRAGARLYIKGQLVVEPGAYLCLEDANSIMPSGYGTYTVSPGVNPYANPALGLSGLACSPSATPPVYVSMISSDLTNACLSGTGQNNNQRYVVNATGGTGTYSYNWYLAPTGWTGTYQFAGSGPTANICLNNCASNCMVKLVVTSGSQQSTTYYGPTPSARTALYPNPAQDYVDVANDNVPAAAAEKTAVGSVRPLAPMQVTVYNSNGKPVLESAPTTAPLLRLSTREWPAGLYQVVVRQGEVSTRRQLSVQH